MIYGLHYAIILSKNKESTKKGTPVMKLLLDTANLKEIEEINSAYSIIGVTTNPTILSKEGKDPVEVLLAIRKIIGNKELHVQLTENEFDLMMDEAHAIVKLLGENTFIKVPVSELGLKVTKALADEGIGVTETAIFTAAQAMLAAEAGAAYVAPYVSRIENLSGNGIETVADIACIFSEGSNSTQILAASFKTARQVVDTALAGAHTSTVPTDILRKLVAHTSTDTSIEGFDKDFKGAFGGKTLLQLINAK